MKQLKVVITKLGKRIAWKGISLSTPCKFIIDESDKIHIKVLLKRTGVTTNEYTIKDVKAPSAAIVKANESAKKQAEASAKEVTKAVKNAPKVEEKKVEVKVEVKKPVEAPKHFDKKNKKNR